ncbi:hypothetical protein [Lysinibacillus capsici]|nr:hypothetical protein [Lysinibacillus capsici]WNN78345.1 hypothetical protein RKS58_11020 [Lysinibacillus capsici]
MNYATHTEIFIKEFYNRIDILTTEQLDFKTISAKLDIHVFNWSDISMRN